MGGEKPVHGVTIPQPFAVGVYEVTFAQWDACVAGGGCGGYRPKDRGWGRGERPVINMSWKDAKSYVAWLSREAGHEYRLLSEAEWEYAARAGTTTEYHWRNSFDSSRVNNGSQTVPVGGYAANAFGLHDMRGNVEEWAEDCWHKNYAGAPSDGAAWTGGGNCGLRVLRGGSWLSNPRGLRAAYRYGCQWRSKKGPPRRCKKGPLGGCGLVPVVHGRAPRATRRALNRLTRRRAREGPVGPRGQAWAGWSVQLAVGV